MKTRFEIYLENFPQHDPTVFAESKNCVIAAEEGQLGKLSRVFNSYPLNYEMKEEQYTAVDLNIMRDWISRSKKIISRKPFDSIEDSNSSKIISTPEAERDVENILADILIKGCEDLLSESGNFRPRIVEILGLQTLIRQHAANLNPIIFQMLYSYSSQIVNANISADLFQDSDLDIFQINYFNLYFQSACCTLNNNSVPVFSAIFKEKILQYIFDQSIFSEKSCAGFLKYIPTESITELVAIDVASIDPNIEDCNDLYMEIVNERGKFWREIMMQLQKDKDASSLTAVWNGLPKSIQDKWNAFPDTLTISADDQAQPEIQEQKNDGRQQTYNFKKWFHVRDNSIIIDNLVRGLATKTSTVPFKTELQNYKFDKHLMQTSTSKLFKSIYERTDHKKELLLLLKNYIPNLAVDLQHQSGEESSISIAIQNKHWRQLIPIFINLTDMKHLTAQDLKSLAKHHPELANTFVRFLNDSHITLSEQIALIDNVINKRNVLGIILHSPSTWLTFKKPDCIKTVLDYKKELDVKMQRTLGSNP